MENITPFTITDEAQNQIVKSLSKEKQKGGKAVYFRISIESGGCSGFQYVFSFDSSVKEDDILIGTTEGPIVVDATSYGFIEGAQLTYEEDLMTAAFVIRKNPKAQLSCGCGSSFSPL